MRRKIGTLLAAFMLAALFPAASSGAASGACQGGGTGDQYLTGYYDPVGFGNSNGIAAAIDPHSSYFTYCTGGSYAASYSYAWVGVAGNADTGLAVPIIQVGIMRCNGSPTQCGESTPRYFGANAGCLSLGADYDLGVANWSPHSYIIDRAANGDWRMWIDGVLKHTISTNDPQIWCWDDSGRHAEWAGERGDRGDGLGLSGSNSTNLQIYNMQHKFGGSWSYVNGTGCSVAQPTSGVGRSYCIRNSPGDDMYLYTIF